jgi:hypothetical protein
MVKLFIIAWVLLGSISFIVYLIRGENKLVLGIVFLAALVVVTVFIRERLRRKREGFFVNTRGNADGGDIIYQENGKSLTFYFNRGIRTVYVPSNRTWEELMPDWARTRKAEILERIRNRVGKTWKFEDKSE